MESTQPVIITIEATVNSHIEKVWKHWNESSSITQWCHASDDWHAPFAENDIQTDGKFKTVMAAKDGSFSFDFEGIYTNVIENELIEYSLADGRKVKITFSSTESGTIVTETFDAESINPVEMQRSGWQAILDNFKKFVETN